MVFRGYSLGAVDYLFKPNEPNIDIEGGGVDLKKTAEIKTSDTTRSCQRRK